MTQRIIDTLRVAHEFGLTAGASDPDYAIMDGEVVSLKQKGAEYMAWLARDRTGGPPRTNKTCVMKTFRFDPDLVEDMERVLYFTGGSQKPKYTSMTDFVVVAMQNLIKQERRTIEAEGVAWESLKPKFKQSTQQEDTDV